MDFWEFEREHLSAARAPATSRRDLGKFLTYPIMFLHSFVQVRHAALESIISKFTPKECHPLVTQWERECMSEHVKLVLLHKSPFLQEVRS